MVRENINVTMPEPAKVVRRFANGDEILERYVVQSELGQGGMGVVYKCFDKIGGVEVAVKGLPPEVAHNSDEMEAVRENFQLVSELHHPNIAGVRTLEKDLTTGDYYLVMTLARGISLRHWLRQHGGKEHRAEQLNVLRQIASALDYAHNAEPKHIIHRDVKPENIMVDDGGHVMVLDFGLAAQVRSSLSRVSQVVTSRSGTPAYKSPEQWLAQAQRAPSDQYSLGVIAYQMFAGELPFDSDDLEILKHAVVFDPVPAISDEDKKINVAFAKVLAKKPLERFASCAAFIAALEVKAISRGATRKYPTTIVVASIVALAVIAGLMCLLGRSNAAKNSCSEVMHTRSKLQMEESVYTDNAIDSRDVSLLKPSAQLHMAADLPRETYCENEGACKGARTINRQSSGVSENESKAETAVSRPASGPGVNAGEERTFDLTDKLRMKFCWCPATTSDEWKKLANGHDYFMMGNPRWNNDRPHPVKLTDGFWMGKYEVTQKQWDSVMKTNPASFKSCERPVENVSWNDCYEFIRKINANGKVRVSFPTEAQWEYACRAGTTTTLPNGCDLCVVGLYNGPELDAIAWYGGNSSVGYELLHGVDCSRWRNMQYPGTKAGTHPVGKKLANAWGLHDVLGNVYEWCLDWYSENYYAMSPVENPLNVAEDESRICRGGMWGSPPAMCSSGGRYWQKPNIRSNNIGFRIVCLGDVTPKSDSLKKLW